MLVLPRFLRRLTPRQARRAVVTVLFTVGTAVLSQYPDYRGAYANVVGAVSDVYLSRADTQGSTDIALVTIDEADYQQFFDARSPLDPVAVVSLVETLRQLRPAVVGVDILTEDDAYSGWPQGKAMEEAFPAGPRTEVSSVPVVWAASAQFSAEGPNFLQWLFSGEDEIVVVPGSVLGEAAGENRSDWGVPVFRPDDDRSVRRLPRQWLNRNRNDKPNSNTFARAVAWRYCWTRTCHEHGRTSEVFLGSARRSIPRTYAVRDLLTCLPAASEAGASGVCRSWELNPDAAAGSWSNTILIVGGSFAAARDAYPTAAGESTPGLMLNALGVRAETEGPTLVEPSRLFGLALDIIAGFAVGWFFQQTGRSLRWKTVASLSLIGPAFAVSFGLFLMDRLWVTWVVMLLSSMGWNIVSENILHPSPKTNPPGPVRRSTRVVERTTVTSIEVEERDPPAHT